MARALIVGCGCLGTELGRTLVADGWAVRGTSRTDEGAQRIGDTGLEGVVCDPDRVGTVLEHVGDVAVLAWALGGASGASAQDVNGHRLERMLERLVDTPVRGFVLDAPPGQAEAKDLVATAGETWQIPVRIIEVDRARTSEWVAATRTAVASLIGA